MALSLGTGLGLTSIAVDRSGVSYSAEATALFARFTTPPTDARKALIDALIVSLKTAGVWAKLDALYLTAAATSQAARQNWVQDLYNISAANSPTFTADRGYAGDGATSYLNTNFTPSSAVASLFSLNSGHISLYDRTSRASDSSNQMGGTANGATNFTSLYAYVTGGYGVTINDSTGLNVPVGSGAAGFFVSSRTASNALAAYKNGSLGNSSAAASSGLTSVALYICGRNTANTLSVGSTDQIAQASIGSGLTAGDVTNFNNAITTYLTAVGA
jgi:hypothetical protein